MADKLRKKFFNARGFTLVELLIVIAIIAILTVAFLPTLRGGTSKARDASKKALVTDVATVFESMINDGKTLPANKMAGVGDCLEDYSDPLGPGKTIAAELGRVPQTFPAIATDANHLCVTVGKGTYIYYKRLDPTSYLLGVEVENLANANVEDDKTTASIKGVLKAADAIALTDGPITTGNKDGGADFKFWYIVGK